MIATLWLLVFAAGTQAMLVAPLIPQIALQLDVPAARLGSLVTAYSVAVGAFALVTGPISDRIGRRRVLLAGTALLAVALAAHGLADSYLALLSVRGLAGVAGGVLNGAAVAYVGDYFPPERRGRANGWVISGFAAGQVAGIPVGTLLATVDFRVPFLLFAALSVGALALVYAVLEQPDGVRSDLPLTPAGALRGYGVLLGRREVAAATVVFFLMFGGSTLYLTFLPTWLVAGGVTAGGVALLFFLGGGANAVVGPVAGGLADGVGRKRVIVATSVALVAAMLATPLAGRAGFVAVAALFVVVMSLYAARASAFTTTLTELVEGSRRGSLMSLTVGVGQLGVGLGGALAGGAYAAVGYPASAFAAAGVMAVVTGLIVVYLPATGPGTATDSAGRAGPPTSVPEAVAPADGPDVACDALSGPVAEGGYTDDD